MNEKKLTHIALIHRWAIGVVCTLSFFAYLFLNTIPLGNNTYAGIAFPEAHTELSQRQTKSFITFVFEEATSSLKQSIFKRLK